MLHLAYISKVFGIKGGVALKLFNQESNILQPGLELSLKMPTLESYQRLEIAQVFGGHRLIFKEINNEKSAAALVGAQVYVARELLAKLPDDEYYLTDILGAEVLDTSGLLLGIISGFSSNGPQVLLEVQTCAGPIASVPLVKAIVREVLLLEKKIILDPPIGLLDVAA